MTIIGGSARLCRYDDADHKYWWGDIELPSVTTIIKQEGLIDADWYTDESRERGKFIAEATALFDQGTLDIDSVDPRIRPYFDAWLLFCDFMKGRILYSDIEHPRFCPTLGFAGTPDRIGLMDGRGLVLDIKTGPPEHWHQLQTAGYAILADMPAAQRMGVHLKSNGKFTVAVHDDSGDDAMFRSLLNVNSWKRRHGCQSSKTPQP